jgi:hypothetical protein
MLDMTLPPTMWEAGRMKALGYTTCGVYIGGIRAAAGTAWHQIDGFRYPVRDLVPYFSDGFLPILVPRNLPWDSIFDFTDANGYADGQDANILAGACGFGPNTPYCVDIEAATSQKVPWSILDSYVLGIVRAGNEVGHGVGIYGTVNYVAHLVSGLEVDFKWMAGPQFEGYINALPNSNFDPAEPPPSDGWQYGGGAIAGVAVDYNSWTDSFVFAQYG